MINTKRNKKPQKVINKEANNKTKPKSSYKGFYYSFLTIILILCLIQITISAILIVSKIVSHNAKIVQMKKTRDTAKALNEQLKNNINNFSNVTGLEEIARNNLKMSSEDEVLIIINTTKEDKVEKERPKRKGFTKYD